MARNIVETINQATESMRKFREVWSGIPARLDLDEWGSKMSPEEFDKRGEARREQHKVDRILNFLIDASCVIMFCLIVFIIVWGFTA
jgi:hypothetical protein